MADTPTNPQSTPETESPPPPGLLAGMVATGDAEIIRDGKVVTDNCDEETR